MIFSSRRPKMSLPSFEQIFIHKSEIESVAAFKSLLNFYHLKIAYDEPNYYILDGNKKDLDEFVAFWKAS